MNLKMFLKIFSYSVVLGLSVTAFFTVYLMGSFSDYRVTITTNTYGEHWVEFFIILFGIVFAFYFMFSEMLEDASG